MGESLSFLQQLQNNIYMVFLIGLALLLFVALIRAVKGPQVADRLVAVNMMGTIVMVMLAILALRLEEDFLLDICLIYAMVSFLAVIVFTKVYIGIYEEKRHEHDAGQTTGSTGQTTGSTGQTTGSTGQTTDGTGRTTDGTERTTGGAGRTMENLQKEEA